MKTYTVKLYPTKKQQLVIDKTIGCCRFIYNQMLNERITVYNLFKDDKDKLYSYKYKTEKEYKKEFSFLKEATSRSLQQTNRNLLTAYQRFFKGMSKFPKFKKKKLCKWSYKEPQISNQIRFEKSNVQHNGKLLLPKLGYVKYRGLDINYNGIIKSVTIVKDKTNNYYAKILVEQEVQVKQRNKDGILGIDLGISNFITTSDKVVYKKDKLEKLTKKINKYNRYFSRKQKGDNRKSKFRIKLARLYKKKTNIQNHFFYEVANNLCSDNQVIKIENINIKGMLKNRKLSRVIQNCAWSTFINILKLKSKEYKTDIIEIDRFYPSTQLCSCCGNKQKISLKERIYTCNKCNLVIDRDYNASINIKNYKIIA